MQQHRHCHSSSEYQLHKKGGNTEQKQENGYPEYPIFKGLQRPLEFMGIQGRYIYWAAATAGTGLVGFVITYCLLGFIAGLATLVVALGSGALLILVKQKRGLHTKKTDKGIFVYATTRKL